MTELDLTTLDGLLNAVSAWSTENKKVVGRDFTAVPPDGPYRGTLLGEWRGTYCGQCGAVRRMALTAESDDCEKLQPKKMASAAKTLGELGADKIDPMAYAVGKPPPIFSAVCLECRTNLSIVVDNGPPVSLVVLGGRAPGLASSESPEGVRYYLDQAYRARTRGAFTAAVVMYRAALEHLLHAQGFEGRVLQDRIDAAIAAQPRWLVLLDDELMTALRRLGNRAVHVNDGDLAQQTIFDRDLVREIELLFTEVLDEIYVLPARRAARRERLREAHEA